MFKTAPGARGECEKWSTVRASHLSRIILGPWPSSNKLQRVPDGKVCLNQSGELAVTKVAVEPVSPIETSPPAAKVTNCLEGLVSAGRGGKIRHRLVRRSC